ncbi:MAG TPA: hypothetical protein VJJ83_03855, partial [Candidatus Babeliales bacterium]|nr:hypothetical protein [Candidatus Babeliales bacterium]
MKNYAVLTVLMLAVLPGCWRKKTVKPVSPAAVIPSPELSEREPGYSFTGDADEFEIEDELAGDAFDTDSTAPDTSRIPNPQADFDWDEIAYDNQSTDPIQFDFDD